jgi:hypothetical protein
MAPKKSVQPEKKTEAAAPAAASPTSPVAGNDSTEDTTPTYGAVPEEESVDLKKLGYALGAACVRRYAVSDLHTARKALSDNFAEYLLFSGAVQRTSIANIRLALGAFAIFLGGLSHLAPIPFPQSVPLIVACIVLYYIGCAMVLYILRFVEGDCFFEGSFTATTSASQSSSPKGTSKPAGKAKVLRFTAKVSPFDPHYTLSVQAIEPRGLLPPRKLGKPIERTYFFGQFFSQRGIVYPPAVESAIQDVLRNFHLA